MPARKNNPDKYRGVSMQHTQLPLIESKQLERLVKYLKEAEIKEPNGSHYVSWADMTDAKILERARFLEEDKTTKGCFYLTDKFRTAVNL